MATSAPTLYKYYDENRKARYMTEFNDPMCEWSLHYNAVEYAPESFPECFAPERITAEGLKEWARMIIRAMEAPTTTTRTTRENPTPIIESRLCFGEAENTPRVFEYGDEVPILCRRPSLPGLKPQPAFKRRARSSSLKISPSKWPSTTHCAMSHRRVSTTFNSDANRELHTSESSFPDTVRLDHQGSTTTNALRIVSSGNSESQSSSATSTGNTISSQVSVTPSSQSSLPDSVSPRKEKNEKKIRNNIVQKLSSTKVKVQQLLHYLHRNQPSLPLQAADEEEIIWTDIYSLYLPSEISFDKSEEDYLRRTQSEEILEALKQRQNQQN